MVARAAMVVRATFLGGGKNTSEKSIQLVSRTLQGNILEYEVNNDFFC